jgi:hypothetical protein
MLEVEEEAKRETVGRREIIERVVNSPLEESS